MRLRMTMSVIFLGLLVTACGATTGWPVVDATYHAIVPTSEQFVSEAAQDLPGGFVVLRDSEINEIEVSIKGDRVTLSVDGGEPIVRTVTERFVVRDSEGSGPFKGSKEVLALGEGPLVIGELMIADPVIWPGSFEDSPVITIKPRTDEDRGPGVSCSPSEMCLLLSSGNDPVGGYEDANNPALDENPISTIEVSVNSIEFTLDSGEVVSIERIDDLTTTACGLSMTAVWNVPAAIDIAIEDPVLVDAACPSTPGDTYLVIMDRTNIPVLAPLGPELAGEWCQPAPTCLLFVPTD